jgi:hypothetical protein
MGTKLDFLQSLPQVPNLREAAEQLLPAPAHDKRRIAKSAHRIYNRSIAKT